MTKPANMNSNPVTLCNPPGAASTWLVLGAQCVLANKAVKLPETEKARSAHIDCELAVQQCKAVNHDAKEKLQIRQQSAQSLMSSYAPPGSTYLDPSWLNLL